MGAAPARALPGAERRPLPRPCLGSFHEAPGAGRASERAPPLRPRRAGGMSLCRGRCEWPPPGCLRPATTGPCRRGRPPERGRTAAGGCASRCAPAQASARTGGSRAPPQPRLCGEPAAPWPAGTGGVRLRPRGAAGGVLAAPGLAPPAEGRPERAAPRARRREQAGRGEGTGRVLRGGSHRQGPSARRQPAPAPRAQMRLGLC